LGDLIHLKLANGEGYKEEKSDFRDIWGNKFIFYLGFSIELLALLRGLKGLFFHFHLILS